MSNSSDSDEDELFVVLDSEGRIEGTSNIGLSFQFGSWTGILGDYVSLDDVLHDCQVADNPLTGATYWLSAAQKPRFLLEQLARNIFDFHTQGVEFDTRTSGAEWWVQQREEGVGKGSLGFHWDKDEELRIECGVFVFPHISTVTYLTGTGAPTVIMPTRADSEGRVIAQKGDEAVYVSYPAMGKHVRFDGRYLHGVPEELLRTPGGPRVTFLVNIWINRNVMNIKPFPEGLVPKLRLPVDSKNQPGEFSKATTSAMREICADMKGDAEQAGDRTERLVFDFGLTGCEYSIQLELPTQKLLEDTDISDFALVLGDGRVHVSQSDSDMPSKRQKLAEPSPQRHSSVPLCERR